MREGQGERGGGTFQGMLSVCPKSFAGYRRGAGYSLGRACGERTRRTGPECKYLQIHRLFWFVFSYITALPKFKNQPFVFMYLTRHSRNQTGSQQSTVESQEPII
jgi:hypothetical protein